MYARYVPPSKKSSAPQEAAPAVAPEPVASPRPAPTAPAAPKEVGGAGFTYSRYIPGSKPAAKPTEQSGIQYFDDEPEPSPSQSKRKRQTEDEAPRDSPQPENKKSKKLKAEKEVNGVEEPKSEKRKESTSKDEKKSKKKKAAEPAIAEDNAATHQLPEISTTEDVDEEEGDEATRKKKRKEEKRKKKLQEADYHKPADGDESDDPDVPMNDAIDPDESRPQEPTEPVDLTKKEKKRKKDKGKKKAIEQEEDPDSVDERHKIMLERKTKSLKLASEAPKEEADEEEEPEEIHDLEPLPQPKLVSEETPNPAYETLPKWLAAPIRVSQDTRTPFSKLGILPKASRILEERGFPDAFAVQTAAIPLLLPTSKERPGDLLISAATGSGKTLAYALPIVRDLSQGVVTRLRAIVVLPTRELVKQAQEVFELCAKVYEGGDRKRVRIGVSIGSQTLKSEQESLIECESRYDPEAYKKIQDQRRSAEAADPLLDPGFENSDPRLGEWEGQVNEFFSTVDVLLCTPGRLVEHIEQTRGFDLDYVRWLVVDEADKLLAQSFQGWLEVLLEKFKTRKFTAREFPNMDLEGVRKVVLSATLTRDLSLLNQLELSRPRLIVLEGDSSAGLQVAEHTLPGLLEESAIRVRDTALKPLYLLELLKGGHMKSGAGQTLQPVVSEEEPSPESDNTSDSSSDSDSTSDSDIDSDSSSEGDTKPNKPMKQESTLPIALVFTKSNESALRLSRLLTLLDEAITPHISTLTSTTPTHIRRKTLRAFTTPSSPIRLIIASDLVARGIDLPKLDHVINYDLPPSAAAYVHRVGRTARAGRRGSAWTLVGDDESGWFWGKIAKGSLIRRAQKVGRTMIDEMDDEQVASYEAALAKLGQEAMDTRKKR